ncbi:MAG: DUF2169 domain-containing protein [Deltaproteobacteria bacterium]|nr:DUF2169 domain-containing protein [Deltaproteobacteria bacterium]
MVTVVVKGTYEIKHNQSPSLSTTPWPIVFEDQYLDEPGTTSIIYESDITPFKPATDVVLVGAAHGPKGRPISVLDVALQVGDIYKHFRVFGDRRWKYGRFALRPTMTRPKPFSRMPIIYERAFGGADPAGAKDKKEFWEKRNPIGTGFFIRHSREAIHDRPLPNIEDPKRLIRSWKDKPSPQGFGFIARHWMPRVQYAGTYDEAWREKRCPMLPEDFDERYFQSAHPDLVATCFLSGNEPVRLVNLSVAGIYEFALPGDGVAVSTKFGIRNNRKRANLDTVALFPDESKMVLLWRSVFSEFMSPWDIKFIEVSLQ